MTFFLLLLLHIWLCGSTYFLGYTHPNFSRVAVLHALGWPVLLPLYWILDHVAD